MSWISVKVEKPIPVFNEYVLTWDGEEIRFTPTISFRHCGEITHWQPLPEPPQEN